MIVLSNALLVLVACSHTYFLILEMFLWTKPIGLKVFGQNLEKAKLSAALAANQGLYNGFLAAGLIWGLIHPSGEFSMQLKYFFLGCVTTAGVYGGYSVNKKIFFIQAFPALVAMIVLAVT